MERVHKERIMDIPKGMAHYIDGTPVYVDEYVPCPPGYIWLKGQPIIASPEFIEILKHEFTDNKDI